MSKDIYTSRDDLVCGKLDMAEELAIKLGSIELIDLLKAIRHDCERMEAGLVRHKDAFSRVIRKLDVAQSDAHALMVFCIENAFDAGYDAGLFRGFENANKVNSKQITKPKAMTFKQFLEQKFGIE